VELLFTGGLLFIFFCRFVFDQVNFENISQGEKDVFILRF
jgi:hypothetical protein